MNLRTLPALCALALTISAASAATFSNLGPITIPNSGAASPYPSTINVAGQGLITSITVDLFGFTHTFPDDVNVLLVSPTGTAVDLMGDAGGTGDIINVDLTFDDAAATAIPDGAQLSSGTYRPFQYGAQDYSLGGGGAPAGPYQSLLASLIGQNPNGDWRLFVFDDAGGDVGSLSGWALNINGTSAIPEPATTVMMAAGLALCALSLRRRKA